MTYHGGAWVVVADAINARMRELNISQGELARRAGVSRPTVKGLMDGNPRGEPSPVKKRAVSIALGWEHDGIDCLLEGKQPTSKLVSLPTPADADAQSRLRARIADLEQVMAEGVELGRVLDERVEAQAEAAEELAAQTSELQEQLSALAARLFAVERRLDRPADDGPVSSGR